MTTWGPEQGSKNPKIIIIKIQQQKKRIVKKKEQKKEQMRVKAAMLWGLYLRRLLGWRRWCSLAASAVAMASSGCVRDVPLLP